MVIVLCRRDELMSIRLVDNLDHLPTRSRLISGRGIDPRLTKHRFVLAEATENPAPAGEAGAPKVRLQRPL